jgi:hypothetical protein
MATDLDNLLEDVAAMRAALLLISGRNDELATIMLLRAANTSTFSFWLLEVLQP